MTTYRNMSITRNMANKLQEDLEICALCGKRIVGVRDKHHLLNGTAYRKKSEEDGLYVYLHHTCHMWLHEHPISLRTFKQRAQRYYEENIGTRKEFIKRYGKNYLEE